MTLEKNGIAFLLGVLVLSSSPSAHAGASFMNPGTIYAVPGIPCNIHYTRLFDSYTPNAYLFDAVPSIGDTRAEKPYSEIMAEKQLGRCYADCWQYIAKTNDAGRKFKLTLNAWNDYSGLVNSVTVNVEVVRAPTDEEKRREISLAIFGSSSTNSRYQDQLLKRMREAGFVNYRPVGTHTTVGDENGAKHDGYGGWAWFDFLDRYTFAQDELDKIQDEAERQQMEAMGVVQVALEDHRRRRRLRSPIVRIENGKKIVDFQPWFDRINGGKAPTYLVIFLGGNGVWAQRAENYQYAHAVDDQIIHARTLISKFRAVAPDSVVAVCSTMGGSLDQDSWGHNNYSWTSCVLANKAYLDYNRKMKLLIESFHDPHVVYVPVTQNVDHLKVYPLGREKGNAVHPTLRGGELWGDALFAWLLHDIEERKW